MHDGFRLVCVFYVHSSIAMRDKPNSMIIIQYQNHSSMFVKWIGKKCIICNSSIKTTTTKTKRKILKCIECLNAKVNFARTIHTYLLVKALG